MCQSFLSRKLQGLRMASILGRAGRDLRCSERHGSGLLMEWSEELWKWCFRPAPGGQAFVERRTDFKSPGRVFRRILTRSFVLGTEVFRLFLQVGLSWSHRWSVLGSGFALLGVDMCRNHARMVVRLSRRRGRFLQPGTLEAGLNLSLAFFR